MKVFQSLTAVMLLGALSVGSNVAVAKARNHVTNASSRAMKSSNGGQQSAGNRFGGATTTPGNNAGATQDVRGPVNAGTMKQRNNLRGKTSPENVGAAEPGKSQPDLNTMRPGSADFGPGTPVIADGPGHKTNRPADTMKKITTIVRPNVVRQPRRPTGPGKIERNSLGAVVHHDANPKFGERNSVGAVTHHDASPKVSARVNAAPTGTPGLTATKTIPNVGSMPTATVRLGRNLTNSPQRGPIINGSSVRRWGGVGGPTKNIALNGNNFKPKYP
jgi:hypothetical protein